MFGFSDQGENIMANTDSKRTNRIIERARLRRKREQRKAVLRFISALLIVMAVGTFTLSIRSFASDRHSDRPSYKYYTSYTIQDGENLSMLAKRYISDEYSSVDKYISEVVSINHIASASDIFAGQVIILPYYSEDIK